MKTPPDYASYGWRCLWVVAFTEIALYLVEDKRWHDFVRRMRILN